jgi:hypothetical protein
VKAIGDWRLANGDWRRLLLGLVLALGVVVGEVVPIATAIEDLNNDGKPDRRGDSVTITGVVIAPDSLFDTRYTDIYVQDVTAGVNVFSFDLQNADLGDSVMVTGVIDWYRGKTEVSDAVLTLVARNRPLPEPRVINCSEMNVEAHEGELVRLTGITTSALVLAGDNNYDIQDSSATTQMRIDAQTELPGFICMPDTFTLTGVKGQYASDTTRPLTGYQLLPRYRTDFSRSAGDLPVRSVRAVQHPGSDAVTPLLLDSVVRIRARVTGPAYVFTSGTSKSLYVQDSSQGINVYGCDAPTSEEALLDSLGIEWEVVGKVTEYNGLTELSYGAMWVRDTEVVTVVPQLLPFNTGLNENMESNLLEVVGDIVQSPTRSGSGYNMTIRNGTPAIAIRIDDGTGINTSWMSRGRRIRVIGIGGQYDNEEPYNSGYQLLPRFSEDISDTSGAFPPASALQLDSIVPDPFCPQLGQVATIHVNSPTSGYRVTVALYDLEGRLVKELLSAGPGGYHDLKWDGTDALSRSVPAGIYIVNVKASGPSGKTEIISRPVVLALKLN